MWCYHTPMLAQQRQRQQQPQRFCLPSPRLGVWMQHTTTTTTTTRGACCARGYLFKMKSKAKQIFYIEVVCVAHIVHRRAMRALRSKNEYRWFMVYVVPGPGDVVRQIVRQVLRDVSASALMRLYIAIRSENIGIQIRDTRL